MASKKGKCKQCGKKETRNCCKKKTESKNIKPNFVWKKA